jgi:hypothetical protein
MRCGHWPNRADSQGEDSDRRVAKPLGLSGHEHKYDDVRGQGFFGQTRREVLPHWHQAYPAVDL